MRWPLDQVRITSPFGKRVNPLDPKQPQDHPGIDLGALAGTPVLAAADGTVVAAYYSRGREEDPSVPWWGYGWRVIVDHGGGGLFSTYNHMRLEPRVKVGERVKKGQQIGEVGSTGASTGAHLHFEICTANPRLGQACIFRDPAVILG